MKTKNGQSQMPSCTPVTSSTDGSGISGEAAFEEAHGPVQIIIVGPAGADWSGNCKTEYNVIKCKYAPSLENTIHEFGHVFDWHYQQLSPDTTQFDDDPLASVYVPYDWNEETSGLMCPTTPCMAHSKQEFPDLPHGLNEEFADMYLNWIFDDVAAVDQTLHGFSEDPSTLGPQRREWMDVHMPIFFGRMGLK